MTEEILTEETATPEPVGVRGTRIDWVLSVTVWVLLVAVLGLGGWFGYSIYAARESARLASPVGRTTSALLAQIKERPNDASLRVRIGEAYASAGMFTEAMKAFKQALELDPEHTGAYLDMGLVSMAEAKAPEAEKFFLRVLEITKDQEYEVLNQQREQAYFYLGQIAVLDGRFEDAVGFLKEALRTRRDASDTYLYLGRAYHGLGETDAAIEWVNTALRLDPNYPEARFDLGTYYIEQGNEASASVEFRRVADSRPESDQPIEALSALGNAADRVKAGRAALEAGDKTTALSEATIAAAIDPLDVEALEFKATVLEALGKKAEAVEVYRTVLAVDSANKDATAAIKRLSSSDK